MFKGNFDKTFHMLKNYFTIAWRNLWKHKVFSLINISGLSVGIAFTLLIGAYIWGELQVNRHLKNAENQYIILSSWKDPNMGNEIESIGQLSHALKEEYPGLVKNYYNADPAITTVSKGDKHFRHGLQVGDSTLLNMYGLKLLHGDAGTALKEPLSVVISKALALKFFGRADVTGQTLNFDGFSGDNRDFKVTGVLDELPRNTITGETAEHNEECFFNASAARFFKRSLEGWDNTGVIDHVELQPGADPKAVNRALKALLNKYSTDDYLKANLTPYLVKLTDYNLQANGGLIKKMIWTLSSITIFILLMAVINFVNICIGRSSGRMKEMGIRKVLGGLRGQLIRQFLTESVLMVMLATVAALGVYLVGRPYFEQVLGSTIPGLFSLPVYFVPVVFAFALLLGLLAGIYPALVLSALKTIDSLKGKIYSRKENVIFRKGLVIFQFMIAAIVFISCIIITQQVKLFFSNSLGYNKDYVIYTPLPRDWSARGVQAMEAKRYQLAQVPQISSVALSFDIPNGHNGYNFNISRQGAKASQVVITECAMGTDYQFASVYDIPMKAGMFFGPVYRPADSSKVVINETESKALGWASPADAVGQKLMIFDSAFTISGVTADFHFGSMHDRIMPITFTNINHDNSYRYFSIRLKPGNIQQSLAAVQKKWAQLMPAAPFDYSFMDDALAELYKTEIQLKKAAYTAAFLAVIIVLLGVTGLISLSIQKRTREIGIRKVLGSSVSGITSLFLKDFMGVIIIGCLIACPLAYLLMEQWLNDYAYRVRISPVSFIISNFILLALTSLLIALQTLKAAAANPIKSLKSE